MNIWEEKYNQQKEQVKELEKDFRLLELEELIQNSLLDDFEEENLQQLQSF